MKLASSVIPRRTLLPDDAWHFKVTDYKGDNRTDDGRLMPKITVEVVEPVDLKGMKHTQNFCIGTKDDPDCVDPETQKKTCTRLVNIFEACKFDLSEDVEFETLDPTGCEFIGVTKQKVTKDKKGDGTPNPNAGSVNVEIVAQWALDDTKAPKPGSKRLASATTTTGTKAGAAPAEPAEAPATPAGDDVVDE